MEALCQQASAAIQQGASFIILSDRGVDPQQMPIPALLATAGVHHHLVRAGTRVKVGLIVESGEPREVHHVALLLGYGAGAVNPYLAFETLDDMIREQLLAGVDAAVAVKNYLKALNKGVVKVTSKMGISTIQSYRGAQIFEAIGLDQALVDKYFTWTASRVGGIGIDVVAQETSLRHHRAYPDRPAGHADLDWGGQYQWRRDGEHHMLNPETVAKLQHAARANSYALFKEFSKSCDDAAGHLATLRGLMDLKYADRPIPIDEVEPVESIVTRFATGAMSYGSISAEAHETLAIAMNRMGGRSNCGEGGEDPGRYGTERNSRVKQVASGRFGVTSHYLVSCTDLQIKMAQGAKPGEGGQLPGHKVYPWIAKVRYSTPGVGLISPPPHHDIYSIEDLAQLIHDLKNANRDARIHVKLVSEVGVGTVAAGVAKAHADVVLISGHDGGTGASPLSSIKHAGLPWELGLAETQQVLVANQLRDRITVQTDGQMKTGRDVVIAALLGAEEYGFSTAPLAVLGCIMMRVCHLNTCPVGIATQDPELAQEIRRQPRPRGELLPLRGPGSTRAHGASRFPHAGRDDRARGQARREAGGRSLEGARPRLLADSVSAQGRAERRHPPHPRAGPRPRALARRQHHSAAHPQRAGIEEAGGHHPADSQRPSHCRHDLGLGGLKAFTAPTVCRRTLFVSTSTAPPARVSVRSCPRASASRSKATPTTTSARGLSGARLVVYPPRQATFVPEENIIIGNVALYGATAGRGLFPRAGRRGASRYEIPARTRWSRRGRPRLRVHDRRARGRHRSVGRNFAAGMSGGLAFVLDVRGDFKRHCNSAMVDIEALAAAEDHRACNRNCSNVTPSTRARRWRRSCSTTGRRHRRSSSASSPKDYKRVLAAIAKARQTGVPEDQAVMGGGAWARPPASWSSNGRSSRIARSPSACATGAR